MKRLLIILLGVMLLVACGDESKVESKKEVEPEVEEVSREAEVIYDRDHDVTLIDNENINVKLIQSRKESLEGNRDDAKLKFLITNKKERTYEFYFREMQLDKDIYELEELMPTSTKIGPGEEQEVMVIIESENEIQFDEYISGMFVHLDYEKNVHEEEFGKYIIEK